MKKIILISIIFLISCVDKNNSKKFVNQNESRKVISKNEKISNDHLITFNSVGQLKIGMKLKEISGILPEFNLKIISEGQWYDGYYFMKDSSVILKLTSKDNSTITGIEITSDLYHTNKGIRVGSDIYTIQKAYPNIELEMDTISSDDEYFSISDTLINQNRIICILVVESSDKKLLGKYSPDLYTTSKFRKEGKIKEINLFRWN